MPTLRLGRRERICTSGEEPLGLSQGAALGLSAQGAVLELSAQDAGVVLDKPKPEPTPRARRGATLAGLSFWRNP